MTRQRHYNRHRVMTRSLALAVMPLWLCLLLWQPNGSMMVMATATAGDIDNDNDPKNNNISLAMMIGSTDYFVPIRDAFLEQCAKYGVHCVYRYRTGACPDDRMAVMEELMAQEGVQGIAMNPCR